MARANQGGSILGFVVIGGVLTLLLLGGIYFVRQKTVEQVRPETASAPSKTETQQQQEANKSQPSTQKNEPAAKPEKQPAAPSKPAPEKPKHGATGELPQTGPESAVLSAVALGVFTAATLSYVRSRRGAVSL